MRTGLIFMAMLALPVAPKTPEDFTLIAIAKQFDCTDLRATVFGVVPNVPKEQSAAAWCTSTVNHTQSLVIWAPEKSLSCSALKLAWARPMGKLEAIDVEAFPLAGAISYSKAEDPPPGAQFTGRLIHSTGASFETYFICLNGEWFINHVH